MTSTTLQQLETKTKYFPIRQAKLNYTMSQEALFGHETGKNFISNFEFIAHFIMLRQAF